MEDKEIKPLNVVFFGDSITDMGRNKTVDFNADSYGSGYTFYIEGELSYNYPNFFNVYNRGISGNRIVDLLARIKCDIWNINPNILGILIGANDVCHEIAFSNGVEIERYEKIYDMIIKDTKVRFPNIKITVFEPFVLKGKVTNEKLEAFMKIKDYAKIARKVAKDNDVTFIELQNQMDEVASKIGEEKVLFDGIHPTSTGAKIIAESWLKWVKKEYKLQ